MIFTKSYVTRWHDTDAERRVRITQMLVYMQETSNAHLEDCGISLDRLRDEKHLAFILSKIRMKIYAPLYAFENIEVQTWTCKGHGFSIPRFYRILRDGELIADADTVWALVDVDTKRIVSEDALSGIYDFENENTVPLDLPLRFKLPKDKSVSSIGMRRIVYSDLDYNRHMNNTKYPDMLCDFIPATDVGRIRGVFLSYLGEAAFGDTLDVRHLFSEKTHYFRTVNQDGKVCLEAELILE